MAKVTIIDVALKANVSISTVSRYLNSTVVVSPDTAERIRSAIDELHFIPNANARSLKQNKTHVIGLVISDISNNFFSALCKSVESLLYKHGYYLMICSSEEDPSRERRQVELLREKCVDGIIISPTGKNNGYLLDTISEGIPVVVVDRFFEDMDFDYVVENNEESAYALTSMMIEKGHKDIAFMRGVETATTGILRYRGYERALRDNGIEPDKSLLYNSPMEHTSDTGIENAVERMLKNRDKHSAVLFANPRVYEQFISTCRKQNISIPREMSYAAFTTRRSRDLSPVKLTCAVQEPEIMGLNAGEQILKRLGSDKGWHAYEHTMIKIKMKLDKGESIINNQRK